MFQHPRDGSAETPSYAPEDPHDPTEDDQGAEPRPGEEWSFEPPEEEAPPEPVWVFEPPEPATPAAPSVADGPDTAEADETEEGGWFSLLSELGDPEGPEG